MPHNILIIMLKSTFLSLKRWFFDISIYAKLVLILSVVLFVVGLLLIEWIQLEFHFVYIHHLKEYLPAEHLDSIFTGINILKEKVKWGMWVGGGILYVLSVYFIGFLSRWITRRVMHLAIMHQKIANGDLNLKTPVYGNDEIGRLETSFNEMVETLAIKEKYRRLLDQITDKTVVERLVKGEIELGGEERDVSILFCDIRGFTQLSSGIVPKDLIHLLNDHMTLLADIVEAHHGVIDKFIGDSLMVIFGSPRAYGNDAEDAFSAAKAMHEQRFYLNQKMNIPLQMGIGIASGKVVAGCMGSPKRMNYTVIGDRVNLASRLCAKAGPGEILIDQKTFDFLDHKTDIEPLLPLELKGFNQKVVAYRWGL